MAVLILLVIFAFGLVYPIVIYPALLAIFSRAFSRKVKADSDFCPDINIIIAAYNEEKYIARALESIVNSDYPPEKIHVLLGSDGSNDGTVRVAESFKTALHSLEVFDFARMGKNNVINELETKATCEFVFFMDADFRLHADTLRQSAKYFADQQVTGVMSRLRIVVLENGGEGAQGEGAYQQFERLLKMKESAIWTTVNNFGFYGVRRACLRPIPNANVCDDMYNVLSASLAGGRVVFANESEVDEVREKSVGEELHRRIRLAAGGLSTSFAVGELFNPCRGWVSWFFLSHKFSRYLFPLCMLGLIILTPLIPNTYSDCFVLLASVQGAFYLLALLGWLFEKFGLHSKLFSFPYFFLVINAGVFLGIIRFLSGKQNSVWERIDTRKAAPRR